MQNLRSDPRRRVPLSGHFGQTDDANAADASADLIHEFHTVGQSKEQLGWGNAHAVQTFPPPHPP